MGPETGRAFVLAVDFAVNDAEKTDRKFLEKRKALIETVIDNLLNLIDTHDKVGSTLFVSEFGFNKR